MNLSNRYLCGSMLWLSLPVCVFVVKRRRYQDSCVDSQSNAGQRSEPICMFHLGFNVLARQVVVKRVHEAGGPFVGTTVMEGDVNRLKSREATSDRQGEQRGSRRNRGSETVHSVTVQRKRLSVQQVLRVGVLQRLVHIAHICEEPWPSDLPGAPTPTNAASASSSSISKVRGTIESGIIFPCAKKGLNNVTTSWRELSAGMGSMVPTGLSRERSLPKGAPQLCDGVVAPLGRQQLHKQLEDSRVLLNVLDHSAPVCDVPQATKHACGRISDGRQGSLPVEIRQREDEAKCGGIEPPSLIRQIEPHQADATRLPAARRGGREGHSMASCDVRRCVPSSEVQAVDGAIFRACDMSPRKTWAGCVYPMEGTTFGQTSTLARRRSSCSTKASRFFLPSEPFGLPRGRFLRIVGAA